MEIGELLDKVIMLGAGIFGIYLSKTQKEKLGNKAKLVKYCGIMLIIIAIILILSEFLQ